MLIKLQRLKNKHKLTLLRKNVKVLSGTKTKYEKEISVFSYSVMSCY